MYHIAEIKWTKNRFLVGDALANRKQAGTYPAEAWRGINDNSRPVERQFIREVHEEEDIF